jgi:hypothetical protein
MSRTLVLVGAAVAALIICQSATAQLGVEQPPSTQVDRSLIGLLIVSADGQNMGQVTEVGVDDGQAIVIGEIERPLGIGADPVAIPVEMFVRRGDRLELTVTAVEVRDRLARPEHQR